MSTFARFFGANSAPQPVESSSDDAPQRVGVIDIGSNSVRLVVFDNATRTPAVFYNEKKLCGLGEELEKTGRLSAEGKARCLEALRRFAVLAERLGITQLAAVGTAALREASDGEDFVEDVRREVGLEVRIAGGEVEARLAAQGVLLGDPYAKGVVADLGGASMELVEVTPDGVEPGGVTTALGALRILNWKAQAPSRRIQKIDKIIAEALEKADGRLRKPSALYVLGGSWRALVNCYMEKHAYPLRVLHGFTMPYQEAVEAADWASTLTPSEVMELAGVSESRAVVTPPAAAVLSRLMRALKPKRLVLSAFGLREGVLWELLPEEMRVRDPLIDACDAMEQTISRMPGFGPDLWEWLQDSLEPFEPGEKRLAHAACLLADANWRTHPDYRSRSSFELVTRNTLGGVDHADRLYIAAALLNRHKGGRKAMRLEPAMELLDVESRQRAEALGKGMRLGVMLAGAAPGRLQDTRLKRLAASNDEILTLQVSAEARDLVDGEVAKRLESFGAALGLETKVVEA